MRIIPFAAEFDRHSSVHRTLPPTTETVKQNRFILVGPLRSRIRCIRMQSHLFIFSVSGRFSRRSPRFFSVHAICCAQIQRAK